MYVVGYYLNGLEAVCIFEYIKAVCIFEYIKPHMFGLEISAIQQLCVVNKCKAADIEIVGIKKIRVN